MKKILLALLLLASPAFAANQWTVAKPLAADNVTDYPAAALANNGVIDRLLQSYKQGQVLVYKDAATVTVGAGGISCTNSSTGAHVWRYNSSSTDVTFADIDTGSEAPSTTYYVYANCDADATTVTYKISVNSSTPSGLTSFKRLGQFTNDGSSNITPSSLINDDRTSLIEVQNGEFNLGGKTLKNAVLGQTTTGSSAAFNAGTTIAIPAGCYVTGGYKQVDGNFIRWDYACP